MIETNNEQKDLTEELEDEYDLKIAEEAYEEYLRNGKKSRPIQEFWDEIGL